jgi:hypothetical protein
MAEEDVRTDQEEAAGDATGDATKVKASLARRATRSLRRARAVYEGNEWKDSNEAEFLLQEAQVFALMDLADAVRNRPESVD